MRYIDADEALRKLDDFYITALVQQKHDDVPEDYKKHWKGTASGINYARNTIIETPTADVVEVVRCKDCKHLKHSQSVLYGELECGHCRRYANYLPMGDTYRSGNDYCSYGERREG